MSLLIVWVCLVVCSFAYESHQGDDVDADTKQKRRDHYHHNLSVQKLLDLERRAGHYWQNQMDERYVLINPDFVRIKPTFPCLAGVIPLGGETAETIRDGHKYACGLHVIDGPPIVYSYGSHLDDSFERSILEVRPDAKIYIFEIMPEMVVLKENQHPDIKYYNLGLGGWEGSTDKSMKEVMIENNHTYIDIVKMDIEGWEFDWFENEGKLVGPRIGQLLVEVHKTVEVMARHPGKNAYTFLVDLEEDAYLRLFHTEVNVAMPLWGVEFAVINANWISWNLRSKYMFSSLTT